MSEVRIVVVDDNPDAAEVIAELLRMNGYVVETVYDGAAALALVERFEPHVVVLDCMMPDMGGFELATEMRKRHGDDIVLIAVTGLDPQAFGVSQTFAIVDHYLHKPIEFDKLTKVLPNLDDAGA
jgi:DNA-binding response OmpR family regulator